MVIKKQQLRVGIIAILCVIWGATLQATILEVDPIESKIKFTANQLWLGPVKGEFLGYSVVIKLKDSSTIERIEAMIDTNTIFTNNKVRDRHLRQPRFLDYKTYDYITFIAKGPFLLTDETIKGKLTIKGVTKEIEVPVKFQLKQVKKSGQYVLAATINNIKLNRHDYGVSGLSGIIRDNIDIDIELVNKVYIKK